MRERFATVAGLLPGLLLCAAIGLAAAIIAEYVGGSALLYALLIGMALHAITNRVGFSPGTQFSARTVLQLGVALLGLRISANEILALGMTPLVIALVTIPATIVFGLAMARVLGMTKSEGVLSGGAVAICGASAAMAIAAVLPERKESEQHLIFTIVGVTALSTLAMLAYPLLVALLPMSGVEAGFFLGGTIHNVPQVVGAGFMISDVAGDTATFTKLLRVAMLAPAVLIISITVARGGHASSGGAGIPGFLIAFVALVIVNSLGWVPTNVSDPLQSLSRACLVVAIAAIGIKASFGGLVKSGWRPALLLTLETLFLAGIVLAGLFLLR
ncbi:MAG TPA: putative sulfate exporter family transporter [Gammaproteobacteria bacterium]